MSKVAEGLFAIERLKLHSHARLSDKATGVAEGLFAIERLKHDATTVYRIHFRGVAEGLFAIERLKPVTSANKWEPARGCRGAVRD